MDLSPLSSPTNPFALPSRSSVAPLTPHNRARTSSHEYAPLCSSPLAPSTPVTVPMHPSTHATRRSSFKSMMSSSSRRKSAGDTSSPPEDPQKAFIRDRFRARCVARAQRDREEKVQQHRRGRSRSSDMSSDGFDADMDAEDEDEGDEEVLDDELFNRIIAHSRRRVTHDYKRSYADEVGLSSDPGFDPEQWERELQEPPPSSISAGPKDDLFDEEDEDEYYASLAEEANAIEDFADLLDDETALNLGAISDFEDDAHGDVEMR